MSEPKSKAAILNLDYDILWMLFKLCATDENESPPNRLKLMRRASHVCATWRDILINSSTMWGNLFCMHHEDPSTSAALASEVLKRSGNSLLHLSVTLSGANAHVSSFEAHARQALFLEACRSYWFRISHFFVTLHSLATNLSDDHIPTTPAGFNTWAFLDQPAPNLRSFTLISRREKGSGLTILSPAHFMSNTAPLLQNFVSTHFNVNVSAPWFSRLRIFSADQLILPRGTARSFHLQMLQTIKSMTCVEHLRVPNLPKNDHGFSVLEQAGKLPVIKLPQLCSLRVAGPLPNVVSLASAIIGELNDLSLTIEVSIDTQHPLCKTSLERLSKYFERTVNFHSRSKDTPCSKVYVVLSDHSVELSSFDTVHQAVYPERFYHLNIKWRPLELGEEHVMHLADIYRFTYYQSSITTVFLKSPDVQWSLPLEYKYIHLLSAFSSVTTIETNLLSFYAITYAWITDPDKQRSSRFDLIAFFPALQTVRILREDLSLSILKTLPVNVLSSLEKYCINSLSVFLHARQNGGAPISLLDIQDPAVNFHVWLPEFDKLVSLKIAFYDAETEKRTYTCGSGLPKPSGKFEGKE